MSDHERGMAIAWIREGRTLRDIGARLGVSYSVILRLRDRYEETGNVRERDRSGRPGALTRQQNRFVVLAALPDRTATANTIRTQLRETANVNVSDQTVRNRLNDANLRSRRPAVMVPLNRIPATDTSGVGTRSRDLD